MSTDVIRIIKSQKDAIEKLIPSLLSEYEKMKPTGIYALDTMIEDHKKAIQDRNYSTILSILIAKAAHDIGVDLTK